MDINVWILYGVFFILLGVLQGRSGPRLVFAPSFEGPHFCLSKVRGLKGEAAAAFVVVAAGAALAAARLNR